MAESLPDIKTLTLPQLEDLVAGLGQPRYRAAQVYRWLHKSGAASFDDMKNVPQTLRESLNESTVIGSFDLVKTATSSDGTIKFLFKLPSANLFETVLIPDIDAYGIVKRITVCVSSQVGCAMGCTFCATGTMGFKENLSGGAIVDQVRHVNEVALATYDRAVTNVVFMGMGEPMLNYDQVQLACRILTDADIVGISHKKITVSTVGLAKQIRQFAADKIPANLAVSLHAPDDAKRSSIMPVNRSERTDLSALREALVYYSRESGKVITYEYCMFSGFNDTLEDAADLGRILNWAPGKVNLIMYNPVPGKEFQPTDNETLNEFIKVLVDQDIWVTVRRSRGQDIDAACGQLAASA